MGKPFNAYQLTGYGTSGVWTGFAWTGTTGRLKYSNEPDFFASIYTNPNIEAGKEAGFTWNTREYGALYVATPFSAKVVDNQPDTSTMSVRLVGGMSPLVKDSGDLGASFGRSFTSGAWSEVAQCLVLLRPYHSGDAIDSGAISTLLLGSVEASDIDVASMSGRFACFVSGEQHDVGSVQFAFRGGFVAPDKDTINNLTMTLYDIAYSDQPFNIKTTGFLSGLGVSMLLYGISYSDY